MFQNANNVHLKSASVTIYDYEVYTLNFIAMIRGCLHLLRAR